MTSIGYDRREKCIRCNSFVLAFATKARKTPFYTVPWILTVLKFSINVVLCNAYHVKYLFLRNIHDDRYEMTVKYLRNAGSDLQECITAIRK
jgi:hypothetical protein